MTTENNTSHQQEMLSAQKYLNHHRNFQFATLSFKILLVIAILYATTNEVLRYQNKPLIVNDLVGFTFVGLIVLGLLAGCYFSLAEMADLKRLPELFNIENARQIVATDETLIDVQEIGNKYMISSATTKLFLNKNTTAITVIDNNQELKYQQEISYFDKQKFASNFENTKIDPDEFLAALPADYLAMFTGLDHQLDTLLLTESVYTKLNNKHE